MHAMTGRIPTWLRALLLAAVFAAALPSGIRADSHKTCTLDGQNFMAFGNYDPMSNSPLDLQGRVSYRCYNDNNGHSSDSSNGQGHGGKLIVQISLSAGNAGSFNRYMSGPSDRLSYNLYMDPQRQTVWGDGTGGTRIYSEQAQPNNHVVAVPVYGRVFGAQDVRAGTYLDNVIVTLDF